MDVETMPFEGGEVWVVRAPHLVPQVFTDRRFSKEVRHAPDSFTDRVGMIAQARRAPIPALIFSEGETHQTLRRLHQRSLARNRLEALREQVTLLAHRLWDAVADETDLVRDFAQPLPVAAISTVLGLPPDVAATLRSLVAQLFEGTPQAAREVYSTIDAVVRTPERLAPGMITDVLDEAGADLTAAQAAYLVIAGYESSTSLVGSALWRAIDHPGVDADDVVETALRLDPPFPLATWRFTTEEVQLGDVVLPARVPVLLDVGAANRHADGRHLSFGLGAHHCVGAVLGRMQAQIAVSTLRERFPQARIVDTQTWLESVEIRKLGSLRVRLREPAD